ncbi:hypothetical protein KQI11_07600 [Acetanaerobacterium sp. MSJ-12]|uniref:hypothetical protein n=1 Tax=Acetanaerobacterium sp. MSJ-12 TaxID=2841535 RepID=UPI001C0F0606|nr:hypothetical protein [Acetanaerobacterium sp. MSJ-12]MBU5419983.1 hypothetical protein [Acetanaerobacterium sp. MSJ-12]
MSEVDQKRKCFIITPIGEEGSPIRRHIDGIIDASVIPALQKDYNCTVAHRISQSGSITKQVIQEIYESDLVIANLTTKNPNVMYELAFRHCLGKPCIIIAENETSLPFDIAAERTVFYENDASGVIKLSKDIQQMVEKIDYNSDKQESPIYEFLRDILAGKKIIEKIGENKKEEEPLAYIIKKLNDLDTTVRSLQMSNNVRKSNNSRLGRNEWYITCVFDKIISTKLAVSLFTKIIGVENNGCSIVVEEHNFEENTVLLLVKATDNDMTEELIKDYIQNILRENKIKSISIDIGRLS